MTMNLLVPPRRPAAGLLLCALLAIGSLTGAAQASPRVPGLLVVSAGGPYSGTAGSAIGFDAGVTGAPVGSLATCTWSFGDGSTGSGCTTSHAYSSAGSYSVLVTASAGGQLASDGTSATIAGNLSCSPGGPYSGQVGQPISMSAGVGGAGSPFSYSFTWSFGDGSTGLGQTTSHVYAGAGSYTVGLSASSGGQAVLCGSTSVTVSGSLSVSTDGPYSGQVNQPVSMTATVAGAASAVSYTWLFGDGGSGTGASVVHTYMAAGKYFITVSAASNGTSTSGTTVAVIGSVSSVTFQPGWNLVAAPAGTSYAGCEGPLFTLQPGDSSYESVPATSGVSAGEGYWCYFAAATTVMLDGASSANANATVFAPPGQYIMVGNPSASQTLTVRGADVVFSYDPTATAYAASTTLPPGRGAWVESAAGAEVTIGP